MRDYVVDRKGGIGGDYSGGGCFVGGAADGLNQFF